jgi:hypothetical protein
MGHKGRKGLDSERAMIVKWSCIIIQFIFTVVVNLASL